MTDEENEKYFIYGKFTEEGYNKLTHYYFGAKEVTIEEYDKLTKYYFDGMDKLKDIDWMHASANSTGP